MYGDSMFSPGFLLDTYDKLYAAAYNKSLVSAIMNGEVMRVGFVYEINDYCVRINNEYFVRANSEFKIA
jgi:hypothetical protein